MPFALLVGTDRRGQARTPAVPGPRGHIYLIFTRQVCFLPSHLRLDHQRSFPPSQPEQPSSLCPCLSLKSLRLRQSLISRQLQSLRASQPWEGKSQSLRSRPTLYRRVPGDLPFHTARSNRVVVSPASEVVLTLLHHQAPRPFRSVGSSSLLSPSAGWMCEEHPEPSSMP